MGSKRPRSISRGLAISQEPFTACRFLPQLLSLAPGSSAAIVSIPRPWRHRVVRNKSRGARRPRNPVSQSIGSLITYYLHSDHAQFEELGVIDGRRLRPVAWGRARSGASLGGRWQAPSSAGFAYPSAPSSRWIRSRSLSAQTQEACLRRLDNRQKTKRGRPRRSPWRRLRERLVARLG